MVILTDGYSDPHRAKTAVCLLRYRPEEVVAVLDRQGVGSTCEELLGVGGELPVVGSLAEAPGANTLLLGIAPPGGKIPATWRPIILEAVARGMDVVSGLHDFLGDDPEFTRAARKHGARLIDVRRNDEHDVSTCQGIRDDCLRIHTVGRSCSCGKMVVAVELVQALQRAGVDAKFVATGQTGIMIEGDGCPVDCVVSDFVAGAAEKLVLANQHHEVIVVEGQGSLADPRYSGVTLGLLHGLMPDGLILCYEMGCTTVFGMDHVPLPPLVALKDFFETAANFMHPCKVIGLGVNGRAYSDEQVAAECDYVGRELGLPACDVIRHGPDKLVQAVLGLMIDD
jgi:uncharacterized NAD-dependent epimerase/dehydratase family protein